MTMTSAVVARIIAQPVPMLVLDTCNFLDLFRGDTNRQRLRVPPAEIKAALDLLRLLTISPVVVHLVVPELVPGEYADHADQIQRKFEDCLAVHAENQELLVEAANLANVAFPVGLPVSIRPDGLAVRLRQLANDLLAAAIVLDRDSIAVNRALARLIAKRRPSHSKEIKDSINLEQTLELCSQLRAAGHSGSVAFVSSNTNDFALTSTSEQIHPDLVADFTAAGLDYFTNLRATCWSLRKQGLLP